MTQTDLDEFIKSGNFLKAEEVKKSLKDPFIIKSEGEFRTSEKFEKDQFVLEGEFQGQERLLGLNKTNARKLVELTGTSISKKWIDKKIYFEVVKMNVSGKIMDILTISKVE